MLARKFSSLGRSLCPRAWRARNATLRPSSVPRTYASEGSPNGVCCSPSCASLKPGMWYRPLPPIMPISACCKRAPDCDGLDSSEMIAELVIIQDGNSWLETQGLPGAAFSSGQKSPSTRFVVSSSRLSLMSISLPRTSITTTPSSVSQACRPRNDRQESAGGASSATLPSAPSPCRFWYRCVSAFAYTAANPAPFAALDQRETHSTRIGADLFSFGRPAK